MSDLIDRQMAIDALGEEPEVWSNDNEYELGMRNQWLYDRKTLESLPSAQVELKRGYWIDMDSDLEKYDDIRCSCCMHVFTVDAYHWTDIGFIKDDLNFCPNCGARMVKEGEEHD